MGKECDREEAARIDAALKTTATENVTNVSNVSNVLNALNVLNAMNATTNVSNDCATNATNATNVSNANTGTSTSSEVSNQNASAAFAGTSVLNANAESVSNDVNGTSDSLSADEEDKYPNKKFFKCGFGFIAWALWGHIPILDSAGMQGDFFSDAKKNASFGRNTESRAAFRKLLVQKNGAGVDNRRGKKRRAEEEEASTLTPTPIDSSKILEKTLQYGCRVLRK